MADRLVLTRSSRRRCATPTVGSASVGEIVVDADGDAEIVQSSAEAEDRTDELRSYPEDRLASPLALREAAFTFTAGTQQVGPGSLDTTAATLPGDRFTDLLDRQDITPLVLLGVAALVGVGHALAPGHGETVMASHEHPLTDAGLDGTLPMRRSVKRARVQPRRRRRRSRR